MNALLGPTSRHAAMVLLVLAAMPGLQRLTVGRTPLTQQAPAGLTSLNRTDTEPAGRFPRSRELLIQDAELVHGPADRGFEADQFIDQHADALPPDPQLAALVALTALQHSLSPRLLLVLLSVIPTPPDQSTESHLMQMSAWLADGYYGLKFRGERTVQFADGSTESGGIQAGAGHFAVARLLARYSAAPDWADWRQRFAQRYEAWFGVTSWLPPPLPDGVQQPPLLLPWPAEQGWYFTGGPHGAWGVASAWGAVDFAPPSRVGCGVAPEWVLSAAPGRVLHAEQGLVLQDLDGDGDLRTGWVLAYLHIASRDRVAVGSVLDAAMPIGHPSCEGGVADGAHVHFARRFNGEWLPVNGETAPLNLSGWRFRSLGGEYDGAMEHPAFGERMAVTSHRGGDSEVVSDNGAERRAELAPLWAAAGVIGIARHGDAAASSGPADMGFGPDGTDATSREVSGPQVTTATAVGTAGRAALVLPDSAGGHRLRLRLALAGRASAASPITVRFSREGLEIASMASEVDASGQSPLLSLPEGVTGVVDIAVLAPGFLPLTAMGVVLTDAMTNVDLSADGQVLAQPGDVDGDARLGTSDLAAWWSARRDGAAIADMTGDGTTNVLDLWQLLGSLAGR